MVQTKCFLQTRKQQKSDKLIDELYTHTFYILQMHLSSIGYSKQEHFQDKCHNDVKDHLKNCWGNDFHLTFYFQINIWKKMWSMNFLFYGLTSQSTNFQSSCFFGINQYYGVNVSCSRTQSNTSDVLTQDLMIRSLALYH